MKVKLVCESFDRNSGQGVYKVAYNLRERLRRIAELTDSNPDVIHYLNPMTANADANFVTIHDLIPFNANDGSLLGRMRRRMILNKILHMDVNFLVPSSITERDTVTYGIDINRIFEIHWGVDLNFFRPTRREAHDRKRIGYVGALTKRKNVQYFIKLASRFPEMDFIISGKGQEENRLRHLMKKSGARNVHFIGFIQEKNLPEFYNSLDAFIFPSVYEGFGMQLLEAMSCEVPVICSLDTGITPELPIYIEENASTHNVDFEMKMLLEEKKDRMTFGNYLSQLKDGKLKPLKNQRKCLIKNKFTWKDCARQHLKLYETCGR